jgi:hypothetical protein
MKGGVFLLATVGAYFVRVADKRRGWCWTIGTVRSGKKSCENVFEDLTQAGSMGIGEELTRKEREQRSCQLLRRRQPMRKDAARESTTYEGTCRFQAKVFRSQFPRPEECAKANLGNYSKGRAQGKRVRSKSRSIILGSEQRSEVRKTKVSALLVRTETGWLMYHLGVRAGFLAALKCQLHRQGLFCKRLRGATIQKLSKSTLGRPNQETRNNQEAKSLHFHYLESNGTRSLMEEGIILLDPAYPCRKNKTLHDILGQAMTD